MIAAYRALGGGWQIREGASSCRPRPATRWRAHQLGHAAHARAAVAEAPGLPGPEDAGRPSVRRNGDRAVMPERCRRDLRSVYTARGLAAAAACSCCPAARGATAPPAAAADRDGRQPVKPSGDEVPRVHRQHRRDRRGTLVARVEGYLEQSTSPTARGEEGRPPLHHPAGPVRGAAPAGRGQVAAQKAALEHAETELERYTELRQGGLGAARPRSTAGSIERDSAAGALTAPRPRSSSRS